MRHTVASCHPCAYIEPFECNSAPSRVGPDVAFDTSPRYLSPVPQTVQAPCQHRSTFCHGLCRIWSRLRILQKSESFRTVGSGTRSAHVCFQHPRFCFSSYLRQTASGPARKSTGYLGRDKALGKAQRHLCWLCFYNEERMHC